MAEVFILMTGVAILTLCDYFYMRRESVITTDKKIHIKGFVPRGWRQITCFFLIPISLAAVALMLHLFYFVSIVFLTKRLCLIAVLWPIAISDYREMRIPNKLVLCGLLCRLVIMIPELFLEPDTMGVHLVSEGIAVVGAVIVCAACMILSRGSLGMGDLKLMVMMSALLGIEGICYSMFFSIFFSFVAAIIFLLTKKKGRKDSMAFAPFVLAGTVVSLIVCGV